MSAHPETQRERRGHQFYPTEAELAITPPLYDTDGKPPAEKVITLHYFVGSCDWWLCEYDPEEGIGFGYTCLGHRPSAEWGYVSLPELESIAVGPLRQPVERDLHWVPRPASECDLPGRGV